VHPTFASRPKNSIIGERPQKRVTQTIGWTWRKDENESKKKFTRSLSEQNNLFNFLQQQIRC
jgi:hypothetical protein